MQSVLETVKRFAELYDLSSQVTTPGGELTIRFLPQASLCQVYSIWRWFSLMLFLTGLPVNKRINEAFVM